MFLKISELLVKCVSRLLKLYHKRLLWLIDFSPEEEPTWPRSRGRLGMIHPEGHKTVRKKNT